MSAPCAKLMTPVALYVRRNPTAASAAIAPSARPLASNAVNLLTACSRAPRRRSAPGSSRWGGRCWRRQGRGHDRERQCPRRERQVLRHALLTRRVEFHDVGRVRQHRIASDLYVWQMPSYVTLGMALISFAGAVDPATSAALLMKNRMSYACAAE